MKGSVVRGLMARVLERVRNIWRKPPKQHRESVFSTKEKQLEIVRCEHDWEPDPGVVLEYTEVTHKCTRCQTYANFQVEMTEWN